MEEHLKPLFNKWSDKATLRIFKAYKAGIMLPFGEKAKHGSNLNVFVQAPFSHPHSWIPSLQV
jgi:hypothetical protein